VSSGKAAVKSGREPTRRAAQLFARAENLRTAGDVRAAEPIYRQILDQQPGHVAAMRGCAEALDAVGRKKRASNMRQKADEKESENHCTVAEKAYLVGGYEKALKYYAQALSLTPELGEAVWGTADCHASLGRNKTAIKWYQRYLEIEPDEPEALHMLASLGVGEAPDRASDEYVTTYFDRFAADFDEMLVNQLEYRVPELIVDAVDKALGAERDDLTVLDVGCGTGLCGVALKERVQKGRIAAIDGIDLSPKMLSQAWRRRLYRDLIEADLCAHLAGTLARYDLVVSGDVLIYLGSLDVVMAGIARVLQAGGTAIFSLESRKGSGFKLTESGRYAHSRSYVRHIAAEAGLVEQCVTRQIVRLEYGEPVRGDLWVFTR
jgi:predicted TPR repeat methyltransferase